MSLFGLIAPLQATDLVQLYDLALSQDARLQAAAFQKEGVQADVAIRYGTLLPQAALIAYGAVTKQHTLDHDGYAAHGYTLSLNVPLFHWDNVLGYQQARTGSKVQDMLYAVEKQALLLRVARNYFEILDARDQLEATRTEAKALLLQRSLAQEGVEAGTAVINDLQEAQARADFAEAQVLSAQNRLSTRMEELFETIGIQFDSFALRSLRSDHALLTPDPADPESWVMSAKKNNLELLALREKRALAQQEVEKAMAGDYPTADVSLRHGYIDSDASPLWLGGAQRNESVMVQVAVPLYQGGVTQAKVSKARAGQLETDQRVEILERSVVRNTRNAYRDVLTSMAQVTAFTQALKSAEGALEITKEGQQVGIRTMIDILNGERDYYTAWRNLASARHRYVLATLQLKQAAGTLAPDDLQLINGWLQ